MNITVERHAYNPGESFEVEAEGEILHIKDPDTTSGNWVDVFVLTEEPVGDTDEETVERLADDAGSPPNRIPLDNHDDLTAAQSAALVDAGYETVGDLPDNLVNLTSIDGIGSGTVVTLKEIRDNE